MVGTGGAVISVRAALQDEVFRLQQENRVLKGQTQRLVSLLSENARYKALLNSARDIEDELVRHKYVAVTRPRASCGHARQGVHDGLREGQPVLGARVDGSM